MMLVPFNVVTLLREEQNAAYEKPAP